MDPKIEVTQEMRNVRGQEKIGKLQVKLKTTKENIEISEELITDTPSDAQREKLIEKNAQRRRAVGDIKKEIRDIEQALERY